MVEFFPVSMVHPDLSEIDRNWKKLSDYTFRNFSPGDEYSWSLLQSSTDSFQTNAEALAHFDEEFGIANLNLAERCFFLINQQNDPVGSAMAWFDDGRYDPDYGRLHWVVIDPGYRGKGLGKVLIHYTLIQLSHFYSKAFLTTQTTSYPAINIYLDFGFIPQIKTHDDQKAWKLLQEVLNHPSL
ncbi:MAG: GNAT family N-acetyltransferase [Saprospiraceae bacterium]|nr:GNAT family N-acetyltransferase [Saprospiraceae bacterium]